jgi:glycosyltransferase involved in cell wall biosynthesis
MESTKPRVSIGLPIYNAENYLEEAVDSILAQTYRDFELIISDNASTDRTQEICLKYAQSDPRVRYYRNEKNLGAAPNYNRVFQLAQGEYFKWANHDDNLAPEFLARCVEVLDRDEEVVLCMSKTTLIDAQGKYIRDIEYEKTIEANLPNPAQRFQNFLLFNMSASFLFSLNRTNAMKRTLLHGNFTSADLAFLAELGLYGRFQVVPVYLFFRRDHPGQSTKGRWKSERARHAWFDTSLAGKIVLPKWQFLFHTLRAVRRAPLKISERILCYGAVIRWILLRRNFWALGKDIFVAVQRFLILAYWKLRPPSTKNSNPVP